MVHYRSNKAQYIQCIILLLPKHSVHVHSNKLEDLFISQAPTHIQCIYAHRNKFCIKENIFYTHLPLQNTTHLYKIHNHFH